MTPIRRSRPPATESRPATTYATDIVAARRWWDQEAARWWHYTTNPRWWDVDPLDRYCDGDPNPFSEGSPERDAWAALEAAQGPVRLKESLGAWRAALADRWELAA